MVSNSYSSSIHYQTKKILNLGQMVLMLTNLAALNSNTKLELCYHVRILRYRVSHNFIAPVSATVNKKWNKLYRSRLYIVCKRSDVIRDILFLITLVKYCKEKLTNFKRRKSTENQLPIKKDNIQHKTISSTTTEDVVDYKLAILQKAAVTTDQCPLVVGRYDITVK